MDEPWVEVIVQPKQHDHRFRYKCEGNGAGSIPGENNTSAIRSTPTIKIHNLAPNVNSVIVVSCVNRTEPFHPHPHSLVGNSCDRGVCTIRAHGVDTIQLGNVGIQCCRHQDAKEALSLRKKIQVDPFQTGHDIDTQRIDLTAVRLCFQVFLPGPDHKFTRVLKPVVTREIIDKKTVNKLEICRLSHQAAFSCGGQEVFIFCDKAKKGDVQVRFFEVRPDGSEWEAFGGSPEVHKQYAVVCTTPYYWNQSLSHPASVWVQLLCPSDNMAGEPKPFQFIPNAPDDQSMLSAKRSKIEQRGFNLTSSSTDYHRLDEPLPSYSQNPGVLGSGLALMRVVDAPNPSHGYARLPPPYPGQADLRHGVNHKLLTDLIGLISSIQTGQPQVSQIGQQQANLTTSRADLEAANQDGLIRVLGVTAEQTNQRSHMSSEVGIKGTDHNGLFVNFAPTGQHHGNHRPYSSGQTYPNEKVSQHTPLVNNVQTSQPGFNQVNPQMMNCPSWPGYILNNNLGKLSSLDNPAGTVIDVTQAPVEDDDIHQCIY